MSEPTIRCIVIDDEPLASALMASYVHKTSFLSLEGEFNDAEEALAFIMASEIDLVFLDIHMPHLNGLQLAARLPERTRVIFTTAYADHALDGYGVNALHYLLKPVSYNEFLEGASRALALRQQGQEPVVAHSNEGFLTVKSEYRLIRIPLDDIEFVEGLKDYVKIYHSADTKPVLTLMSMKNAEDTLSAPNFMRVHRSFIVNLNKVRIVERNCIIMHERAIPVSDSCRARFAAAIGM